jgi:hypothetical protein
MIAPPAAEREAEPLAEAGRPLGAPQVEIGAAERAPGSEGAYALTTTRANMGSVGFHR